MNSKTTLKLWTGLALSAAASAAVAQAVVSPAPSGSPDLVWRTQAEGEAGEGGEGGGADYATDTVAYLAALDFMLGHLNAGAALYAAGLADHALTHVKHPKDEIYTDLLPALTARNQPGFSEELATLAELVESGAAPDEVRAGLAALEAAITASRGAPTAREELDSLARTVRVAADEYAIAVVDGALANLYEYQDAFGFVQVAAVRLTALSASADPAVAAAAAEALTALLPTDANFAAGLLAEGALGQADVLYGAAARLELAALTLEP